MGDEYAYDAYGWGGYGDTQDNQDGNSNNPYAITGESDCYTTPYDITGESNPYKQVYSAPSETPASEQQPYDEQIPEEQPQEAEQELEQPPQVPHEMAEPHEEQMQTAIVPDTLLQPQPDVADAMFGFDDPPADAPDADDATAETQFASGDAMFFGFTEQPEPEQEENQPMFFAPNPTQDTPESISQIATPSNYAPTEASPDVGTRTFVAVQPSPEKDTSALLQTLYRTRKMLLIDQILCLRAVINAERIFRGTHAPQLTSVENREEISTVAPPEEALQLGISAQSSQELEFTHKSFSNTEEYVSEDITVNAPPEHDVREAEAIMEEALAHTTEIKDLESMPDIDRATGSGEHDIGDDGGDIEGIAEPPVDEPTPDSFERIPDSDLIDEIKSELSQLDQQISNEQVPHHAIVHFLSVNRLPTPEISAPELQELEVHHVDQQNEVFIGVSESELERVGTPEPDAVIEQVETEVTQEVQLEEEQSDVELEQKDRTPELVISKLATPDASELRLCEPLVKPVKEAKKKPAQEKRHSPHRHAKKETLDKETVETETVQVIEERVIEEHVINELSLERMPTPEPEPISAPEPKPELASPKKEPKHDKKKPKQEPKPTKQALKPAKQESTPIKQETKPAKQEQKPAKQEPKPTKQSHTRQPKPAKPKKAISSEEISEISEPTIESSVTESSTSDRHRPVKKRIHKQEQQLQKNKAQEEEDLQRLLADEQRKLQKELDHAIRRTDREYQKLELERRKLAASSQVESKLTTSAVTDKYSQSQISNNELLRQLRLREKRDKELLALRHNIEADRGGSFCSSNYGHSSMSAIIKGPRNKGDSFHTSNFVRKAPYAGFHVKVLSHRTVLVAGSRPFISYYVEFGAEDKTMHITCRFSELKELHKALAAAYPTATLPTLPPDRPYALGGWKPDFIEERKKLLEAYLYSMHSITVVRTSNIYKGFLKIARC